MKNNKWIIQFLLTVSFIGSVYFFSWYLSKGDKEAWYFSTNLFMALAACFGFSVLTAIHGSKMFDDRGKKEDGK